jgi:hypothetical protein
MDSPMFDYLPFFDIFPTEITTKCRLFKNYNSVPKNNSVKILPRPLGEIPERLLGKGLFEVDHFGHNS